MIGSKQHKASPTAIKNRIIYGVVGLVALVLMYVTDVPAFMFLGSSLSAALGMVTFFGLADRFVWSIAFTETHARRRLKAKDEFARLRTAQERNDYMKSPLGQYLIVGDIESQSYVGDTWVYKTMLGFGIMLTVVGIWFPLANRTASVDKKDNIEKTQKVNVIDAKLEKSILAVQDSIKAVIELIESNGNSVVENQKSSMLNQIGNANLKRQAALRDKNYDLANKYVAIINNLQGRLSNIDIDPSVQTKSATATLNGQKRIAQMREAATNKEGSVMDETNFATVSQKILFVVLAIIAPLLVLLMRYLIVYYEVVTEDKRNTLVIVIHEIQALFTSSKSVASSLPVVEMETTKTEPKIIVETATRQILPREIITVIEERQLDLPNFGKLKNYVSRIDTGKNYEALIKALNDYKRELNLTSNFNETTRMFGNSSNPMFFGYCDEWIEKVGYKTKKKNNVVVMTYSKTAE